MAQYFKNPYGSIEVEVDGPILRFTRSATPFPDPAELERSFAETSAVLDRLGRKEKGFLADLRAARGSNTPDFEKAMARSRRRLLDGFAHVAVLVQTAAGALQLRRHGREDGVELRVFLDEAAALRFLRGRLG